MVAWIHWILDALFKWLVVSVVISLIAGVVNHFDLLPEGFDWDDEEHEQPPDLRRLLRDPPYRWMDIAGGRVAHAVEAVSGQALISGELEVTRRALCGNYGRFRPSSMARHCQRCIRVLTAREHNNGDDRTSSQ